MSEKDIKIKQQSGHALADITELVNPFPGLRPFSVEESHLFFGREGQSDEALVKLDQNRFTAILGASGSGKSSFVFCGLIPTLHGGFMTQAGSNWRVVTFRPGGGPIDNLAEALLVKDKNYQGLTEEDQLIRKTIIGTVLRSSSLGLVEVVKQLKTDDFQNVLILVDQFEELFRFSKLEALSSDNNESAAFVNLLLEGCHQREQNIYVALTMRSDFIGECARYPDLTQMINDSHYLIPQMTRDQKRMIVEGPVAVGGGKIAPRLTQQLLNDVGDNPDQLPILQHALMRTWSFWVENRKPDEPMDLRHYNAIGTLRGALSQHANEAYDMLSKREKEICDVMFKALTEKGNENQGIRRPTKLSTIAAIAGVTEDEVEHVIDRFREPGRSLLMPPHGVRLQSDSVVDISHESLMRIWDRLKIWLDEEAKAAEMYIRLSDAATKFQEGKASLWKMPDLQLAMNWREDNNPTFVWGSRYNEAFERTMVFLDTSVRAYETEQANKILLQKRKVKFVRTFAIVAGAIAMVCLFLVVYANLKANEAEELTQVAQDNLIEAQRQEQLALDAATRAREAEAEAIKEKAAADIARNAADEQRVRAEESAAEAQRQKLLADQNAERAREQSRIAEEQRQAAVAARDEADQERLAAEAAKAESDRLRYLSIAQSMAIKSQDIQDDPELRGLVAKQAFDFYIAKKDDKKNFNGDIFSGAYYGIQGLLRAQELELHPDLKEQSFARGDSVLNQYHGHKLVQTEGSGNFRPRSETVPVRSVTYSGDGKTMYSAGGDGRLLKWNVENRSYAEIYRNEKTNRVVNISSDEKWLALATSESEVDLFDLSSPEIAPRQIRSHRGAIYDLVFLPDNSGFISVGADKRILKTEITFDQVEEITVVTSNVQTLAVSPDGKTLAAGSTNGDVLLFDLEDIGNPDNQRSIYRPNSSELAVNDLSFSSSGKYLAIGGQSTVTGFGYVTIYDMELKENFGPRELKGFTAPVQDVDFSPDDHLLAAASRDGTVRMWDMDPDNIYDLPTVFDDHGGANAQGNSKWVFDLDFHPSGEGIMTAAGDGLLRYFPTQPDGYIARICGMLTRNLKSEEWLQYVGRDIDYEETCEGLPVPVEEE